MTTYYVDHAGSNTAPYDTQAKAAPALATILAIPPSAGDIIYCCDNAGAGETIAAELDLSSSGTNAGGWIKIIGCNSSGVVDGTRYVISGGGNDILIFDFAGQDMWWLENIEVTNTGTAANKHGFYSSASGAIGIVFINCCANNCSGNGFSFTNVTAPFCFRCVSYSNTLSGWGDPSASGAAAKLLFCCARDNAVDGFNKLNVSSIYIGCVSHNNTDDGIGDITAGSVFFNCAIDGNGDDGLELTASTNLYAPQIMGCRITNHSGAGDNGLYLNGEPCIVGFSYFEDNTDNINDHTSALFQFIPTEGGATTSNLEDGADTDEGYVDKANHDFSTRYVDGTDPSLRRVAITVPWS